MFTGLPNLIFKAFTCADLVGADMAPAPLFGRVEGRPTIYAAERGAVRGELTTRNRVPYTQGSGYYCSCNLQLRPSHHGRYTISHRRVQPVYTCRDVRSTHPLCTHGKPTTTCTICVNGSSSQHAVPHRDLL